MQTNNKTSLREIEHELIALYSRGELGLNPEYHLVIEAVVRALPEEKTDTRSPNQNPENEKKLTKAAAAYNQAIQDIKQTLQAGGSDEVKN